MKKLILLMTIIIAAFLLVPVLSFAQPKNYLDAEGSSYGLTISKEAKKEAAQARADRLLLYQDEIDELGSDDLELRAAQANNSDNAADVNNSQNISSIPDVNTGGSTETPKSHDTAKE